MSHRALAAAAAAFGHCVFAVAVAAAVAFELIAVAVGVAATVAVTCYLPQQPSYCL